MTEINSPSTSYKGSLDLEPSKSPDEAEHELTFVNPCYAAPTPFSELQPFSSRQSQSKIEHAQPEGGHTWAPILESDEKGFHQGEGRDIAGEENERTMSKTKMFLVASGMCLTYFLGVSTSESDFI